jgi:predicted porin
MPAFQASMPRHTPHREAPTVDSTETNMHMKHDTRTACPKRWHAVALAASVLALAALPARADELSDLKAQMQQLIQKVADLEAKQKAAAAAPAPAAPAPAAQTPSLALSTDQNGNKMEPGDRGIMLYSNGNSSISMYGIVEATISHANNQTASGASATGFQVAYFSGNRLGFDMQHGIQGLGESMGLPDLKVISKLEAEYELPTGNMDTANVLFNRDAWVGFYSKDLGKVTFGRQNTLTRDFTANWGDPYGGAFVTTNEGGYSNANNFKQFIFYSAGAGGTRYNSAVEWKKAFDTHWVVGAAYAFGQGGNGASGDVGTGGVTPGAPQKGSGEAFSVAYNRLQAGDLVFNFNANYDRANKNDLINQALLVGGNVIAGDWRFNAGAVHYTGEQGLNNSAGKRTDNSWTASIQYKHNKWEYDLGYQDMRGKNVGLSGGGTVLNPFFGDATGVTNTVNGDKKSIYGAIRLNIDKQTDVYFASDWFKAGGGWVVGDALGNGAHFGVGQAHNSELEFATGVRFKF